jgi:carbamoyl-phosphate synthase/aspartate carbamoyltransferase
MRCVFRLSVLAINILCEKVLHTLSYEPLTHMSASSEAAMKRCGGDVVSVTAERRSVQSCPILTLAAYLDAKYSPR